MITRDLIDHVLGELAKVHARCPELRFGQMIAIVGELAQDETGHSLWDVEDADFAAALGRFAEDMARRGSDQTEAAGAPAPDGMASSPGSTVPSSRGR